MPHLSQWLDEPEVSEGRRNWFLRIWAVWALALFGATWRLWGSQDVFPQVPFLPLRVQIPAWCEWTMFGGVVGTLILLLACSHTHLRAWVLGLFAVLLAGLLVGDQHRLQPWAYQFLILALIFAGSLPRQAWFMARSLAISVYLYSALSKFDYQFLHTLGPEFLDALFSLVGISTAQWSPSLPGRLAVLFPFGELIVGLSLIAPRTRNLGLAGALVLHVTLLLILGPWGLGHKPGVLLWNGFFMTQALFLFWPVRAKTKPAGSPPPAETEGRLVPSNAVTAIWFAALVLPLSALWNWCDHWPAWELYAPRTSRVQVQLDRNSIAELPESWQQFLVPTTESDSVSGWVDYDLAQWSLQSLNAPIYPQDRFQLGVALGLAETLPSERAIRVSLQGPANRWTGERPTRQLLGRQAVEIAIDDFRVNARPRSNLRRVAAP